MRRPKSLISSQLSSVKSSRFFLSIASLSFFPDRLFSSSFPYRSSMITLAISGNNPLHDRGCIPEWGRDCGYGRVSGPLAGDVRGAQVRCASVSDHERLRAFTSIYERLRAFASAPGRVWSRLRGAQVRCASVSESRLQAFTSVCERLRIFFSGPGTFGRVLSYLVVISRHSSSQNVFFGYGGQRAVAAPAGQGGQQFAAHGSRAGGRMCIMS